MPNGVTLSVRLAGGRPGTPDFILRKRIMEQVKDATSSLSTGTVAALEMNVTKPMDLPICSRRPWLTSRTEAALRALSKAPNLERGDIDDTSADE